MNIIFKQMMMFALLLAAGWTIAQAQTTPDQRLKLTLEDNRSVYTTVGERNQYENDLRLSQPNGDYKFTAGMLYNGDNLIVLHRIDDQGEDTECARINLNAVVTAHEEEAIDGLSFSSNPPSSQQTITQSMLPDNWGTNGSNLIWQTSGYAYISGAGGLTYTIPDGYSNATFMFYIINGSNVRGGYWIYNLNNEGWTVAARATAGYGSTIVIGGMSSGDVISFYGASSSGTSGYSAYQSPDIDGFYVLTLPDSYLPSIEVTPTVSYWDGTEWSTASTMAQSQTYAPNDTIDLYGLGTITDAFDAVTDQNEHSGYYNYKVTLDGNIILPSGSATGLDFYSSADFSACTTSDPASATMSGYNGWTFNESNAYTSSGIISVYIEYFGAIVFTMPNNFMGTSVNVTVTSSTGSDGAGVLYVNGELHTFTAGETHTWTVPVGPNGTIEFKSDGQTYSVDISRIVISSGNGSALSTPLHTATSQTDKPSHQKKVTPISESEKKHYNQVIIND